MKKYLKVIFAVFILCLLFHYSHDVSAINDKNDMSSSIVYLDGKMTNETRFRDGVIRKEVISCYKYAYDDKVPSGAYEYTVIRADVTYTDVNGETFACAYFESTFRYNKKLRLSKCLSTSHGQSCSNNKYSIDVFARTKNLSLDIGESFGKVTLYNLGIEKDKCKYIFSCDKDGNILRCLV